MKRSVTEWRRGTRNYCCDFPGEIPFDKVRQCHVEFFRVTKYSNVIVRRRDAMQLCTAERIRHGMTRALLLYGNKL